MFGVTNDLMKKSNCRTTGLGIESGDDQLLMKMGKGTNAKLIWDAVRILKKNDVKVKLQNKYIKKKNFTRFLKCKIFINKNGNFELKVLKGAKKLIKRYKPTLLVEIEERYIAEPIEKSLNKILSLGYRGFALIGETLTPLRFFDGNKNHRLDYGPDYHANAFIFCAK